MRRIIFVVLFYLGLMFLPPFSAEIEAQTRKRKTRKYVKPPFVLAECDVVRAYSYEEWWREQRLLRAMAKAGWSIRPVQSKPDLAKRRSSGR